MADRSLSISLIVIFGFSGLALLLGSLILPGLQEDRLTAWIAGGIGIGFASIRWFMMRHENQREEAVPVERNSREESRQV